jgi:hypothetical protein
MGAKKFLGINFAELERRILARAGGEPADPHAERAEREGITREEAKARNYGELYGGGKLGGLGIRVVIDPAMPPDTFTLVPGRRDLVLDAHVATAGDALRDAADEADRAGRPGLAAVLREFAEQVRRCAERVS